MSFNDGNAVAIGGKTGRGVVLNPEGTSLVLSGDRPEVVVRIDGLSDMFNERSCEVNVLNQFVLSLAKTNVAEAFVVNNSRSPLMIVVSSVMPPNEIMASVGNASIPPVTAFVSEANKIYRFGGPIPSIRIRSGECEVTDTFHHLLQKTEFALSIGKTRKTTTLHTFLNASAIVCGSEDQRVVTNYAESFVIDVVPQQVSGTMLISWATANVEDYKPPSWGATGSGSGLKSTRIIAQKNSFFELYLNFDDCKVIDAMGLPNGMVIEGSYIKGTPTVSGKYPVTMKLSNERSVDMYVIVPELQRKL